MASASPWAQQQSHVTRTIARAQPGSSPKVFWGDGVEERGIFLVFPHLEKGFVHLWGWDLPRSCCVLGVAPMPHWDILGAPPLLGWRTGGPGGGASCGQLHANPGQLHATIELLHVLSGVQKAPRDEAWASVVAAAPTDCCYLTSRR